MKSHLLDFLRSPLGLGTAGVCGSLMVLLAAVGFLPPVAAVLLFPATTFFAALGLLHSPLGASSVVAERGRERAERDARILGGVAAARKRLSLLRIEDGEIDSALDRLIHATGRYLESSVRGAERDPIAEDALFGAVEAVDDYLRLADADASRRRRSGGEARQENGGDYQHTLAQQTAQNLRSAAEVLESRLVLDEGGLRDGITAHERTEIREDQQ